MVHETTYASDLKPGMPTHGFFEHKERALLTNFMISFPSITPRIRICMDAGPWLKTEEV